MNSFQHVPEQWCAPHPLPHGPGGIPFSEGLLGGQEGECMPDAWRRSQHLEGRAPGDEPNEAEHQPEHSEQHSIRRDPPLPTPPPGHETNAGLRNSRSTKRGG